MKAPSSGEALPLASLGFIVESDEPASLERADSGHAELYCLRITNCTLLGASVVRFGVIVSVVMRRLWLRSLRTLTNDPLPHVGRALRQFDALVFTAH